MTVSASSESMQVPAQVFQRTAKDETMEIPTTNACACELIGNADGLGETRKKELVKSGMALGLKGEDDVFVLDNP